MRTRKFIRRSCVPVCLLLAIILIAGQAWAGPFEEGMALYNKGQYKTAAKRFEAAVSQDASNVEAMKRLGDCYYNLYSPQHADYAELAKEAYKKVLDVDPNDGITRLHLAQIYSWTDDTENAIEQFEELLDREPENTTAMAELAEIYSWKPDTYDKAIAQCKKIIKIDENNKRAHLTAARVYAWKADYKASLNHYEKYLEIEPENDQVRIEYANTLSLAGRYDEAAEQFNYLSKRKDMRDQSLLGLAQAYYHAKRYADAAAVVEIVLKREPENNFAWRLKGLIYLEQRRVNEAIESFKKALEINPEDDQARIFLGRAYAMSEATYPEAVNAFREVLKSQPDNVEVRAELARIYSYANNHAMAVEQYEEMLRRNPDNNEIRAELIRAHLEAENYDAALEHCNAMLELEPDDVDNRLLMAETLMKAGRYDDAIDFYDEILDDHPNYLLAMVGLGWTYHMYSLYQIEFAEQLQEQIEEQWVGVIDRIRWLMARSREIKYYNKAISILTDAAEKHPDATEPHLRMAEVYAQHKAYKSSIDSYEQVLKRDPRSIDAYLGMAWVYGTMGNQQKSIDAIRRAAQIDPSNIEVLGGLGEAYAYQQDVSQAIEALEKVVVMRYADLDLHRRLANLYAQNRRYYPKAIRECRYILEQDPSDDDTRLLLARVLSWNEQYDESLIVYDELLAKRPEDQDLYLEMMKVKVYSGRSHEVIAELQSQLESDPDNLGARLALANAYEAHNEYDLAEAEYQQVLKADPKNGHAHLGLASVYRQREDYDRAIIEYREVLSTNPDSAEAYYGLGVIDRKNGRYERAIAMQKKVLELDPSNINAFAELSYNHYLLSRRYIATTGQYHRAWWLLNNTWGDVYGVWGEYPGNIEQMRAILLEDPGNCDLRYLLAQELQNHNRNKEAVREYRILLKYCPNHIGARIALTDIFSYSPATYAWAIRETQEIIKREPDNYDAHLRLARLYSWSRQYNASIGQYAWCLNRRPDATEVRYELAQTLSYAKRYDEAIKQYRIILQQNPNREDVRMELAKLYSYTNRIEDAARQYEIILKQNPNNYEASFALANLYSWDRRYYHRAVDLYRKLFLRYPKSTEARLEYGRLLYERGEYQAAADAYQDAVTLEPNNVDAHMMLGRIYMGQGQNQKAIAEFQAVLEIKSDHVDAHYYLAQIYSSSPETYDQAVLHGMKVLDYEPKNEDVRLLVANVLSAQERYSEAADQYGELLALKPGNDEYLEKYAINLSYAERYEEAVEQFQKLVAKKPEDTKARLELGMAYLALGMYEDAIVNLEYVTDADPWNKRAHQGLARSYDASGDVDNAILEYKRILIIDPNDQEAQKYLEQYNITYTQASLVDEFFTWPGKAMAQGPGVPGASPGYDEAEMRYRVRLAEELIRKRRMSRARRIFEKLVEDDPNNPYYHLALAQIYLMSNMWHSAEEEYKTVLKLSPGNDEAVMGLARVRYAKAPTLDVFAGMSQARRFSDYLTTYKLGSRFTYRFWNGAEAFGEVTVARHYQTGEEEIDRLSPKVGLVFGLFGDVSLRGEYTLNTYDRIDTTHNYLGAIGVNLFDYVGLEGYYFREDVRQTLLAMDAGIGQDNLGGALTLYPIERLIMRGEYRHTWVDDAPDEELDENEADLIAAGASYTFFDGPYFSVGYGYQYLSYDDITPNFRGIYWAPSEYQQHSIPLSVSDYVVPRIYYNVGVIPSYNILEGEEEDNIGMTAFSSVYWQMALKHRLGLDADVGFALEEDDYYEFNVLLTYTYIFGRHRKEYFPEYE